jgi:hypothetical protein
MATLLPGLGGGTAGAQLQPGQLANSTTAPMAAQNVAAAAASGSIDTSPVMGKTGIAGTPGAQPGSSLPLPTVNPNVAFQNNVQAPASQTIQGGQGPTTNQPQPTVTQMLNTPAAPTTDLSKYGTQGTAAQPNNADIGKKINDAFNSVKDTPAPTDGAAARVAAADAMFKNAPETKPDPQAQFMDKYSNMNPVVKTMYDNINNLISSQSTRTSLVNEYTKLNTDMGLTADKLALVNINNIMKGTADDIRSEITKAGGFATESQVAALTGARNKVLINQASLLQDQITAKEDYVKQIMSLTQADYAEADKQVSEQIGLDEKVAEMQINLDNAAKDNYFKMLQFQQTADTAQTGQYDKNLTNLGGNYTAFASTIPDGMKPKVERLMGLAPGTLSNKDELAYLTASALKQQQLAQAGQKVQISLNNAGSLDQYRQALTDLAGARTLQAQANTVNSTIKSLYGTAASNPITAYRTASIWIGNVNAAYAKSIDPANANKGPSDLELIDAAVKLNNGGQQVTQVQVDALQKAIGWPGKITVEGGKVTGISGLLDTGTRTAIRDLATSNLVQKRIAAVDATTNINSALAQRGVSDSYSLPQLQAAMIPEGFINQGTAADGKTTVYLMPDKSIVDANGTKYDSEGNPI